MARPSPHAAGDPVLVAVGQTIRTVRTEVGFSQEGLAYEAGVDRSYLGGIERGEHNLTVTSLMRLCRCLRISASDLLRRAGL